MLLAIVEKQEGKIKFKAKFKKKKNPQAEKEDMQNMTCLLLSSDCKISMKKAKTLSASSHLYSII